MPFFKRCSELLYGLYLCTVRPLHDNHTRSVEYRGRFIVSLSPHRAELLLHYNGNLLGHVPDAF